MNQTQTNKNSRNNIIDNVAKRIFKYIGLAPKEIKECPNCGQRAFSTYEYLNVISRQVVYSCYFCVEPRIIETKPQFAVIQLGGKKGEERIKKRLEHLKGEKARLEGLEICRSRKNGGLTNEELDQLREINDEIEFITNTPKKPELKEKYYPVKDFLLTHSWLVDFNEKEAYGKQLTKAEQTKQRIIYEKRDLAMREICEILGKYYNTTIRGDFRFDGMPEIHRGIRG